MKIVQAMNNFLWGWGVSIPILIFGIVASIVLRHLTASCLPQASAGMPSAGWRHGTRR